MNKSDKLIYWDYPVTEHVYKKSSYTGKNVSGKNVRKKVSREYTGVLFCNERLITGESDYRIKSSESKFSFKDESSDFELINSSRMYYGILAVLIFFFMLFLSISISRASSPVEISDKIIIPEDKGVINDLSIYLTGEEKSEVRSIPEINQKVISYRRYQVRAGDTVSAIAERFNLLTDTIALTNNITNIRNLRQGSTILIPNQNGRLVKVNRNDSINSLANKYGVSWKSIADVNDLKSKNIMPGQTLFIPSSRMTEYERNAFNYIPPPPPRRAAPQVSNNNRGEGSKFIWPVRGAITSGFGMRRDPFKNILIFHSGIDIRGDEGDPVLSAADGKVSYTGWTNIFGNFILVKHDDDLVSLYGHLSSINVKKGESVKQGSLIGKVGSTGRSTGPHLHFEVRKNNVPVNPMTLLTKEADDE